MSLDKTKNLISKLPKVDELSLGDISKVEETRKEYDALSQDEKKEVSDITPLTNAEGHITILKDLQEAIESAEKSVSKPTVRKVNDLFVTLKDGIAKKSLGQRVRKLENKLKLISSVSLGVKILVVVILFYIGIQFVNRNTLPSSPTIGGGRDYYKDFQKTNPTFVQGEQFYATGQYEQAIMMYEKSRENADTWGENAIIDFSIAGPKFMLDREQGIQDLINISKNNTYDNETRALAMIRAYLLYSKYYDTKILAQLMGAHNIPAGTRREVTQNYMEKAYALYPFAYPAIHIVGYKLSTLKTKEEALALYNQYTKIIENDIEQMKSRTSRSAELTSTMLGKATLMKRLHLEFDAVAKTEVEKAYQDLVNYNQERGVDYRTNKQYTLIAYADFVSATKEYEKAEKILQILFSEQLDHALTEALPRFASSTYPHLLELQKNTEDEKVKQFISFIGSGLPQE